MDPRIVPVNIDLTVGTQVRRITIPTQDEVQELRLAQLSLKEADLEEFVRTHIETLFEDESLLIVSQQPVAANLGRADLIAIDGDGNLVLLELKRDAQDMLRRTEPFETQAIRYAASCATIKTEKDLIVRLFAPYVAAWWDEFKDRGRTPTEVASHLLEDFLGRNRVRRGFNQRQRIVLIASSFDQQTLSGCGWLVQNGIDLRCIRLTVLKHRDQYFMSIEQVLPPPTLEENLIPFLGPSSIRARTQSGQAAVSSPTARQATTIRVADLVQNGSLHVGERVSISTRNGQSDATVRDDSSVSANGQSVSYLTWAKQVTGWTSVNIYDQVFVDRNGVRTSLGSLRNELALRQQQASTAPEASGASAVSSDLPAAVTSDVSDNADSLP